MKEALKHKYFVDGFMIKHFGIFPSTIDKNNLHEIQKVFLVYLCGIIPSVEGWSIDVSYQREKAEIMETSISEIKLEEAEIDLAKLHGKDINKLKKEKLKNLKQNKLDELDRKYKIKDENEEEKERQQVQEMIKRNNKYNNKNILDMLEGRGIIK